MANFFDRSSFRRHSGFPNQSYGLPNFISFCSDPSGFEYFENLLYFSLRKLLFLPLSLPSQQFLISPLTSSQFQGSWSDSDASELAKAARIFSSRIHFCFPDVVIPKLPALTHPSSLIHFLSSLLSCFHNYLPSIPHIPYPHSHELPYILASLRKLVVFAQAQSVCPIVSLSLPPCFSVPSFVTQVTFLAHLFPLSLSLRAKASVFVASTIPADA